MNLSYRRSYKQRRKMRNLIVFIIVAILFIVTSFAVLYIRSLDFGSVGRQVAVAERITLTPLKLQHFNQLKVSSYQDPSENPEGIEIVHGDNQFDASVYSEYERVVDSSYFSDALFIGDSRTEGFFLYTGLEGVDAYYSKGLNIESIFEDRIVKNGNKKQTVIEALQDRQYAKIYIMFGVNELGWAFDYLFEEKYGELIDAIVERQPDAIIYVQNILPISAARSQQDEIYNNDKVNRFNELIKDMCAGRPQAIYLDVASSMRDETGALPVGASQDGVHCTKEYCIVWLNYLKSNTFAKLGSAGQ